MDFTDWTSETMGAGTYADVNGLHLLPRDPRLGAAADPAPRWAGVGRLAILPGLQHHNIFASPHLADVANAFLGKED